MNQHALKMKFISNRKELENRLQKYFSEEEMKPIIEETEKGVPYIYNKQFCFIKITEPVIGYYIVAPELYTELLED